MRRPRRATGPATSLRLLCLPYAGGSASVFRGWSERLPEEVDVCAIQLPGRANRIGEEPFTRMDELLRALVDAVLPLLDVPYALFGHSMGALLAFELARRLRKRVGAQPVLQFVSACRAPHVPDRELPIHRLPDAQFLARLAEVDGIPAEVLACGDLLDLLLPVLRADLEIAETHTWRQGTPLGCPISAFGSANDPYVTPDELQAWSSHTTGRFSARFLPGSHFFIHTAQGQLLDAISADLQPFLTPRRAAVS